jgi:hypothetical protein
MASLGTWPAAIRPATCRLTPFVNQRVNASPFGGSEQVVDMLNDRWLCSLSLPVRKHAPAASVEAFLNSFRGQVNTVNLWHFTRPVPRGTLRGAPTLASLAAQGASSLALTGFTGQNNQLLRPSEFDHAYWTKSNGTISANFIAAPDGTMTSDSFIESATTTIHSVTRSSLTVEAGKQYTFSIYVNGGAGRAKGFICHGPNGFGGTFPGCTYDTGAGTSVSGAGGIVGLIDTGVPGWYRAYVTATASSSVSTATVQLQLRDNAGLQTYLGDGVSAVRLWGAQFNEGGLIDYVGNTTLLAGDLIGAGGQLLMVQDDVNDGGTGAMTVNLVNRLRAQIASAQPVTWDKPTAPFRLLSHSGVEYIPGRANEVSMQLGEAIV